MLIRPRPSAPGSALRLSAGEGLPPGNGARRRRAHTLMASPVHLGLAEFQAIHQIVGQCVELWADPTAWQTHLLRAAARLADCRVGIYYELEDAPGNVCSKIVSATDTGWSRESERCTLIEGLARKALTYSPL